MLIQLEDTVTSVGTGADTGGSGQASPDAGDASDMHHSIDASRRKARREQLSAAMSLAAGVGVYRRITPYRRGDGHTSWFLLRNRSGCFLPHNLIGNRHRDGDL
jgi:hypothetical protein